MKKPRKHLRREEWDFSPERVPDSELEDCFITEFFRELPGFEDKQPYQKFTREEKAEAADGRLHGEGTAYSQYVPVGNETWTRYEPWGTPNCWLELFDFSHLKSIARFDIDWEQSDNEIVQDFREWIKKYRPAGTLSDKRGIKKNSLRVYLERLAIMRLLHHYSPKEIREQLPDAWRWMSQREYFKERKRAVQAFKQLFPPERNGNVMPASWPTKSGRSK